MLNEVRMAIRALRSWGSGALVAIATLAVGIAVQPPVCMPRFERLW
jgi:hypothetical protein